jgi:SAM-dependent methyltransferase
MSREEQLSQFAAWVRDNITGDEKGQAQIFLDRLFQAFGQPGVLDVGGQIEFRLRKAAEDGGGTAFADLVWKPVVLVEMKRRGTDLQKHFRQAFGYWTRITGGRPRYVVLCNFDEFWVYDFDSDLDAPKDKLALTDLPQRWGPLAFLAPGSPGPKFLYDREAVTRKAADKLALLFTRLLTRGVERPLAQRFTLQMLIALFAEDIDLLPRYFVSELLEECSTPADTYDLIGGLFEAMNLDPPAAGGRFKGVRYFNGGLFAEPARVELADTELVLLREAAKDDWSKVQPEIFGTLFEHSVSNPDAAVDERRAFGIHFTRPTDIMKIVQPTIIEPWTEQIEGAKTLTRLHELLDRLQHFSVLDPACGSGNFLYIAYRALKRLEARIYERIDAEFPSRAEPGQVRLSFLSAQNFHGLDINPLAVEIAKVAMMVARKLAIDELHIAEQALPLANLDRNFLVADALLTPDGQPANWPKADVIIGNPPFIGAKMLKPERGPDYVNAVRRAYPDVPGMADYCVYWFRKAQDHLPPCTAADPVAGRAGLVGTQNIRNNQSRVGGLDYIAHTATIIEAVENQPWSGEANVNVSIANWVKTQDATLLPRMRKLWFKVEPTAAARNLRKHGTGPANKEYELDFRECGFINSALSDKQDVSEARVLRCNTKPQQVFNGQFPRHHGFVIEPDAAAHLVALDARNREVIHPFLIGQELVTSGKPERWVIDFQKRNILEARSYTAPFGHIQETVLPHIEGYACKEREKTGHPTGQDQTWLRAWWQHFRCRKELVDRVNALQRYIVCSSVTKRPIFCFVSSEIRADHALFAFTFEDDYSFGILQSSAHWLWFITKCSKLTERFRYTPESVFDTFPWPQSPTPEQVEAVAEAGRQVRRVRTKALGAMKGGLRALYRTLELPGANPLKDAHVALDAAVLAAYGFSAKKDLLAQLLELNLAVAQRLEKAEPVTSPGIPATFTNPKTLTSDDCIRPPSFS